MLPDSTQLSPKKNVGDWRAEKTILEKGASPEVWAKAVDEYFHDRMKTRYLEPIAVIQTGLQRSVGERLLCVSPLRSPTRSAHQGDVAHSRQE